MESTNIVVSVCSLAFNHEKYIARAIEGFLMQKTTFPIEIIIHDDASTDRTASIIKEFYERFPDLIVPIFQTENQYSKGIRPSATFVWPRARGKYIALCEGDDYWTDPMKLQKQVDFLEANEDYVLCCHDAMTIDEEKGVISKSYHNKPPRQNTPYYTVEDFIMNPTNFIPTASIVFRKEALYKNTEWDSGINLGDIFLIVSLCSHSQNNKIKFINEVMSVYRIHKNSVYMGMSDVEKSLASIFARIRISRYFLQHKESFDFWLERIIRNLIETNIESSNKNRELIKEISALTHETPRAPSGKKIINKLNYKSYRDLSLTIKNNVTKIPRDIDLVVGVPRSGIMPATMLGQILNKPVVALDSYIEGKLYEIGNYRRPTKLVTNISDVRKVLIVDDSINSGSSMNKVKERITKSDKCNIYTLYCAVYYVRESLSNIDIGFEECSWPRIFQWNILNSWILANACVDIDGVVCEDPTEEQNDDGEKYKKFLLNAKPLFMSEFHIGCFVSSRLEKYRGQTEEWLRKHNFNYGGLIMLDLPSKEERLKRNIHALFKAEVYRNRKEELFIESNLSQAAEIARLTGKNVFCTESMEMTIPEQRNCDVNNVPASKKNNIQQREILAHKKVKRILFINHNLYPYENSGTPISTLNHALGMREQGTEVAVLIPSVDIKAGYDKQVNDKFILYRLPRLDKYAAFFGEVDSQSMTEYMNSVKRIIADFEPDVVHINDYVYMPDQIVSVFHDQGVRVIRSVCNMEELCHMDYPVISKGLQGELCKGPESPAKCAECYFINRLGKPRNEIDPNKLKIVSEKIERRFNSVKSLYSNHVDGVIFTEKAFQEYFTNFVNIRNNLMRVIPRGFKFDYARKDKPKVADGKQIRFAYVGHIMFSKGTDVVLKAFEEIASSENFHLDLYGAIVDQAYHDWIVRLEKNFPTKIKYHGPFNKGDIINIANSIDVAIVPSNFDTYNRVVRELLYLGVPQIVTDFFGSSVIHHNVNGLKVEIGDHNALAEVMKNVISNPNILQNLSQGAIRTNIPTLDEEVREMLKFYPEAVSKCNADAKAATRNRIQDQKSSARLIAFHLPQYHPIPENDAWWGKGFTEWTNVAKAKPLFEGHHQPQLPADLGFYDLRLPETRRAQADLAREYGIEGFCYWHYWFNGKLLLERPVLDILNSHEPDLPFCLAWANENWTRRWDGHEQDMLQKQVYGGNADDLAHFQWLLRFFKDKRAIKIDDKPLFMVYRPGDLPNPQRTMALWRESARQAGLPGLFIIAIKTSFVNQEKEWTKNGFDAEMLFQPNFTEVLQYMDRLNDGQKRFCNEIKAKVVDYKEVWPLLAALASNVQRNDSLFTSVVPGWDNTARTSHRIFSFA